VDADRKRTGPAQVAHALSLSVNDFAPRSAREMTRDELLVTGKYLGTAHSQEGGSWPAHCRIACRSSRLLRAKRTIFQDTWGAIIAKALILKYLSPLSRPRRRDKVDDL
jgi:hypothetical protein